MIFDTPHVCPVCKVPYRPYRIAAAEDQRRTPAGMLVRGTGPAFLPAHGRLGDHHPVDA